MWPDNRLAELLDIDLPLIQAPMAGANGSAMAIAVSESGGLGSLPCAMLDAQTASAEIGIIRQRTSRPFNVNFFCHERPEADAEREAGWRSALSRYYRELGLDESASSTAVNRDPFDEAMCEIVEAQSPAVVSFHFGLPHAALLERVKAAGCKILSSATTVDEAVWLESRGCDAIIAQGYEAGGHRGMFLSADLSTQMGTLSLVPQVVDAVRVPVIAAGGIADGRAIAAAFALGAAGAQVGTAFLFTPEAKVSALHREALACSGGSYTALTNLFSGRPARGQMNRIMRDMGPMSDIPPAFPTAGGALAALKLEAEKLGRSDFSSLWSGQSASMGEEMDARSLTLRLAQDARARLASMSVGHRS